MSADDTSDDEGTGQPHESDGAEGEHGDTEPGADVRERLEKEADRAIDQFDEGVVDVLAWLLETETRARIYVHLRQHAESTSDEIAEGTGLYPSTVREALASLHDEGKVTRSKRQNAGAGNNPYEYSAIPPSDLVSSIADDVQQQLNTVFNLDRYMGGSSDDDDTDESPVTITVTDAGDGHDDADSTADDETGGETATQDEDDSDDEDDENGT